MYIFNPNLNLRVVQVYNFTVYIFADKIHFSLGKHCVMSFITIYVLNCIMCGNISYYKEYHLKPNRIN